MSVRLRKIYLSVDGISLECERIKCGARTRVRVQGVGVVPLMKTIRRGRQLYRTIENMLARRPDSHG